MVRPVQIGQRGVVHIKNQAAGFGHHQRPELGNPSHRPLCGGTEHPAGRGGTEAVGRPVADGPLHRHQFGIREQHQMLGNTAIVAADQADGNAALTGIGTVERRFAHRHAVDLDPAKGKGAGGMGQAAEGAGTGMIADTEHHLMVVSQTGEHAQRLWPPQQQAGLGMDQIGQQIGHRAVGYC